MTRRCVSARLRVDKRFPRSVAHRFRVEPVIRIYPACIYPPPPPPIQGLTLTLRSVLSVG